MSSNLIEIESMFYAFQERVTQTLNEYLMAHISGDEIKRATFSVKGSSALGEDGLT